MKIGIIDPHSLRWFNRFNGKTRYNVHGYQIEFIKKYKPIIYISSAKGIPLTLSFFYQIRENITKYKIILNEDKFLRKVDALIYLNGGVFHNKSLIKKFKGLKIYHIMDPQYKAREVNKFLNETGIDYLLGYNSYDKHSDFIRKMYPNYIDKIIGVPFGYAGVWQSTKPFEQRLDKALLTGTTETFDWVIETDKQVGNLKDYIEFFSGRYSSMHEIRYSIDKDISRFGDKVDSKIQLNKGSYKNKKLISEVVAEFNNYKFFINDESLLNFCPIRTYEGIAAGCVMIAHHSSCYEEWGFKDGVNALFFDKVEEIPALIDNYLKDPSKLKEIQLNGMAHVKNNFNHEQVAVALYNNLQSLGYD